MIFLFLIYSQITACPLEELKRKSILRGNYKDVLHYQQKSLILGDQVYFAGGQLNSQLNRDAIYYVNQNEGYTYCAKYHSIIIQLNNVYEINTIVVEIWDIFLDIGYNLEIFTIHQDKETKIYDNIAISGYVKIQFNDQLVDKIKFYNRNGNNYSQFLTFIKAQAFYSINI